jgi:hypothetical protein
MPQESPYFFEPDPLDAEATSGAVGYEPESFTVPLASETEASENDLFRNERPLIIPTAEKPIEDEDFIFRPGMFRSIGNKPEVPSEPLGASELLAGFLRRRRQAASDFGITGSGKDFVNFVSNKGGYRGAFASKNPPYESPESILVSGRFKSDEGFERTRRTIVAEEAGRRVKERFDRVLKPILDAVRAVPHLAPEVERFLDGPNAPGNKYILSESQLARRQRSLTASESEYIRSVSPMSEINPGLVALARFAPDVTNIVLDFHFAKLRSETSRELENTGSTYAPIVIIGAGPHGIMAAGEVMRNRPDLAQSMCVIDTNALPGSIWSRPNGDAWEVNSANRTAGNPFELPNSDLPNTMTVRRVASALAWYPAERNFQATSRGRQGSINTITGWMPAPDEAAPGRRYVTNRDIATTLKLQAAVLMPKYLQAEALAPRLNDDPNQPGKFVITVRHTKEDGTQVLRDVYADRIFDYSGKSEPRQPLRNNETLREMKQPRGGNKLPYYLENMDFYRWFADRSKGPAEHGEKFIIMGDRNGAATAAEALVGLFLEGNIGPVNRIVVVGDKDNLIDRKRYAKLEDVILRATGRQNVLFFAKGRAVEVEQFPSFGDSKDPQFVIRGEGGNYLVDDDSNFCVGNHVINATGYRSTVGGKYTDLCESIGTTFGNAVRKITLDNTTIQIGQTLESFPEIVIGGTAINPDFENSQKLRQLPLATREVVECITANRVALSLTGVDTRAAVTQALQVPMGGPVPISLEAAPAQKFDVGTANDQEFTVTTDLPTLPAVDKRISPEPELLTSLIASAMPAHTVTDGGRGYTGTFTGRISLPNETTVRFEPTDPVPNILRAIIGEGAAEPFFRAYANEALRRSRRRSGELEVTLHYKNGMMDVGKSLIQVA